MFLLTNSQTPNPLFLRSQSPPTSLTVNFPLLAPGGPIIKLLEVLEFVPLFPSHRCPAPSSWAARRRPHARNGGRRQAPSDMGCRGEIVHGRRSKIVPCVCKIFQSVFRTSGRSPAWCTPASFLSGAQCAGRVFRTVFSGSGRRCTPVHQGKSLSVLALRPQCGVHVAHGAQHP